MPTRARTPYASSGRSTARCSRALNGLGSRHRATSSALSEGERSTIRFSMRASAVADPLLWNPPVLQHRRATGPERPPVRRREGCDPPTSSMPYEVLGSPARHDDAGFRVVALRATNHLSASTCRPRSLLPPSWGYLARTRRTMMVLLSGTTRPENDDAQHPWGLRRRPHRVGGELGDQCDRRRHRGGVPGDGRRTLRGRAGSGDVRDHRRPGASIAAERIGAGVHRAEHRVGPDRADRRHDGEQVLAPPVENESPRQRGQVDARHVRALTAASATSGSTQSRPASCCISC